MRRLVVADLIRFLCTLKILTTYLIAIHSTLFGSWSLEGGGAWMGSLSGLVLADMIRFLQPWIILDTLGPICSFTLESWSTKVLKGGRRNPGSWFMVGGLEPGGGSLSGLVLADLVTGQTGDLGGGGGGYFPCSLSTRHHGSKSWSWF